MSTGTRRAIQDALFYARSHARFVDAAASFCVHAFVYVSMRDLHSLGRVCRCPWRAACASGIFCLPGLVLEPASRVAPRDLRVLVRPLRARCLQLGRLSDVCVTVH